MSIKEFLPKTSQEQVLVQVRIDKDLHERLKLKLKSLNVSSREFVEASIKAFLKEG